MKIPWKIKGFGSRSRAKMALNQILPSLAAGVVSVRAVRGGRIARESARDDISKYMSFRNDLTTFLRRRKYVSDVSDQESQSLAQIAKKNPEWFLEFLFDREPLLSSVLEKFVDITATQFSISVTKNGRPHAQGQTYIDEFVARMIRPNPEAHQEARDLRRIIRKSLQYLFIRKAVALEVVFDEQMNPVDIVGIDPLSIEFKQDANDPFHFIPYQKDRNGKEIDLDIPNFIWVPHSSWGDPYSRNPLIGAIKKVLGMMQLHQDLELVVHHAAWPRLKIAYSLEKLTENMPAEITDPDEARKWIEAQIDEVVARYADLQADDNVAFAEDLSSVEYLELHHASGDLFSPEQLMRSLEVRILDACDTMSTTIGRSAFSGEGANALDGLVQAAVWGAMRHTVEDAISQALSIALLVGKGIAAKVQLRFEEIVLEPHGKLSVWVKQDLENLRSAYLMGGILKEEMASESRRLTRLMGPVPEGAEVDDDWVRGNKVSGDPTKDPSQESTRQDKRRDSNRQRRSTKSNNGSEPHA